MSSSQVHQASTVNNRRQKVQCTYRNVKNVQSWITMQCTNIDRAIKEAIKEGISSNDDLVAFFKFKLVEAQLTCDVIELANRHINIPLAALDCPEESLTTATTILNLAETYKKHLIKMFEEQDKLHEHLDNLRKVIKEKPLQQFFTETVAVLKSVVSSILPVNDGINTAANSLLTVGLLAGAGAGVAAGLTFAGVINCWNPLGWILLGASALLCLVGGVMKAYHRKVKGVQEETLARVLADSEKVHVRQVENVGQQIYAAVDQEQRRHLDLKQGEKLNNDDRPACGLLASEGSPDALQCLDELLRPLIESANQPWDSHPVLDPASPIFTKASASESKPAKAPRKRDVQSDDLDMMSLIEKAPQETKCAFCHVEIPVGSHRDSSVTTVSATRTQGKDPLWELAIRRESEFARGQSCDSNHCFHRICLQNWISHKLNNSVTIEKPDEWSCGADSDDEHDYDFAGEVPSTVRNRHAKVNSQPGSTITGHRTASTVPCVICQRDLGTSSLEAVTN